MTVDAMLLDADTDARLRRLEWFANLMDSSIALPGAPFRFGLDSVLGLVPGVGDAISAALSSYIFAEAAALKVRKRTMARMAVNAGLDFVVGSVPVVGDLFDVGFKANRRNVRLVIEDVERRAREAMRL